MNVARDQLLARAGLTRDQHVAAGQRDCADPESSNARDSGSSNTNALARSEGANALAAGSVRRGIELRFLKMTA